MTATLLEAKQEYTTILCNILAPYVYQGFQSIYNTALSFKKKNNVEASELRIFQDLLRNIIPNWNCSVLGQEVKRIKIMSKYGDTLEKLLHAIMKATLQIQTMRMDLSECRPLVQEASTPDLAIFIHKVYIASAREFFNNPLLFSSVNISPKQTKDNQKEALCLIRHAISVAIMELLPLDAILSDFLDFTPNKRVEAVGEIQLLNTEGNGKIAEVLSNFNVRQAVPALVDELDVRTVMSDVKNTPVVASHHTLTNFLKEVPVLESEIKQSALPDDAFVDVYNA